MDKAQGFHAYFFSIIVGLEPWNYVWKLQKAQEKFLSYGRILTLHYYFLLMCILFPIVSSIMDFITNNYWLMRKSWIKSRNTALIIKCGPFVSLASFPWSHGPSLVSFFYSFSLREC